MAKNLMIAYEEPFEDSKFIRQLVNQYGVKEKEVHLFSCTGKDMLIDEIDQVEPVLTWLVGNRVRRMANVKISFKVGHGRYVPICKKDRLGMLIPDKNMVAKMPQKIQEEFCERMEYFKIDWKNRSLSDKNKADVRWIKSFAKAYGYKEDTTLKKDKSYFVIFSELAERHIVVVKRQEDKEKFQQNIPFSITMSKYEFDLLHSEDKALISEAIRNFGCDGLEIKKEP